MSGEQPGTVVRVEVSTPYVKSAFEYRLTAGDLASPEMWDLTRAYLGSQAMRVLDVVKPEGWQQ